MTANLLESVREAAAAVTSRARSVSIEQARLPAYARDLYDAVTNIPTGDRSPDPVHHPLATEADTIGFVVLVGTLNFGSGYFPFLSLELGESGYHRMARGVRRWILDEGVPSAARLTAMTAADCAALFAQPLDVGPRAELMSRFAQALAQLGRLLDAQYAGSPVDLVSAAQNKAESLVRRLGAMAAFHDVSRYGDLNVPFYKRAQLLAADLHRALGGRRLGRFEDLDRLTAFADNAVPLVLRADGILVLDPELEARIEASVELSAGSAEEVELRAAAVHVVELLVAELGGRLAAWQLDFALWLRAQEPAYQARPAHLTRTFFY